MLAEGFKGGCRRLVHRISLQFRRVPNTREINK